jgi:hypothetical protein
MSWKKWPVIIHVTYFQCNEHDTNKKKLKVVSGNGIGIGIGRKKETCIYLVGIT